MVRAWEQREESCRVDSDEGHQPEKLRFDAAVNRKLPKVSETLKICLCSGLEERWVAGGLELEWPVQRR